MPLATFITSTLELPAFVVRSYLDDLTEEQLLLRPQPEMNHIAWQLGHLIASEHGHVNQLFPGSMPALPDGFAEQHSRDTTRSDDPALFCSKSQYLEQMERQRAGTLRVLNRMSDEELEQPAPETIRYLGPTFGAVFSGEAVHWMMHAGQWAVIRRMLGKPPLF